MPAEAAKQRNVITDKVVVAKTGKTMAEWFAVLDQKGAKKLDSHGIYDSDHGYRWPEALGRMELWTAFDKLSMGPRSAERGEKKDGFEISVSKTDCCAGRRTLFRRGWMTDAGQMADGKDRFDHKIDREQVSSGFVE